MSDERRKRVDGAYGYAADAQRERAYGYAANAQRERAEKAEAARDEARRKYKRAEDYIKLMDAVIHDLKIAKSCINPLEDLKRATTALKERADKAEAALADAAGINSPHNACARLREDAARYCWLRDDKRGRMLSVSSLDWTGDPKLSDAAIDAARKDTK